jgi:choline dehydrogenase-like flavoprotein
MDDQYEYVVVGSGAGGGTVAARLAELGHRVFLLEAGGDPLKMTGGSNAEPQANRLPADYEVPVFHVFASENTAMKWDFFVRHYSSDEQQKKDPKYQNGINGNQKMEGVLYPRAGTLGGCTSHNAQITVYPHNEDWDYIARLTGDSSWSATNMRKYFQQMEKCEYRPRKKFLSNFGWNPTRHGFRGWFQTEIALPVDALKEDNSLLATVAKSAEAAALENDQLFERLEWGIQGKGDPNDWRLVEENAVGIHYTPLATRNHARHGARERVLDVARRHPDRLHVELNALATRVLLDENNKAIGVEYLKGERLYQAHHQPNQEQGELKTILISREVILSGGTFNTPQLLKLSGIGPKEELEKFQIPVKVDLTGVGTNMQDRYELGVVYRMNFDCWKALEGARYNSEDRQYMMWKNHRKGVYTTNGTVIGVIKRSLQERPLPDLFIFAVLGLFKGYFPNYSSLVLENLNYLTWSILKAHTNNTAGTVKLRSSDPRDVPQIDFHYFDEGNDTQGEDLNSVIEGIKFVRKLATPLIDEGLIAEEELPGQALQSDEDLGQFIKDQAWGHHASCSCPIGAADHGGVVNGDFEVHGTSNLRIVDASVFPRIPGFFIVTSVYMIAEKAAFVISAAAKAKRGL